MSKKSDLLIRNQGYWDGVADRAAQRIAEWYRGAAKNCGHFDADYAAGYELGVFGQEAPPYALTGKAE
jgi:hypothetical protein